MKLRIATVPLIVTALLATTARAEGQSVHAKLGSLGLGVGYGTLLGDDLGLRLGISGGARSNDDKRISGIKYDIEARSGTSLEALADWYPIAGSGFRLSGGLMLNNGELDLEGERDAAGNFSINNRRYAAGAVGTLKGSVEFNRALPYVGVGWESERPGGKGWRFTSDLGVAYLGKGRVSLSASGAAGNAALREDLAREKRQLEDKFDRNVGVIVSVGAAYSF